MNSVALVTVTALKNVRSAMECHTALMVRTSSTAVSRALTTNFNSHTTRDYEQHVE